MVSQAVKDQADDVIASGSLATRHRICRPFARHECHATRVAMKLANAYQRIYKLLCKISKKSCGDKMRIPRKGLPASR